MLRYWTDIYRMMFTFVCRKPFSKTIYHQNIRQKSALYWSLEKYLNTGSQSMTLLVSVQIMTTKHGWL